MNEKKLFINSLALKIIAIIFMSLSHIGIFLSSFNELVGTIFISIGGIAFPIFMFLLFEGLNKTSSIKKYIFRLGILAFVIFFSILIFSFLMRQTSFNIYQFGNIFIDLILYSLIFVILKSKNKFNYFYLLPIFAFFILTYLIKVNILSIDLTIYKIFGGIFPQYSLFGLLLFLTAYFSFYFYDKKVDSIDISFKETISYQFSKNAIFSIILAFYSLLSYLLTYSEFNFGVDNVIESYIVLASLFILFYNAKKGYVSKLVQYFFYLYYPLHILIIFLIFTLIF